MPFMGKFLAIAMLSLAFTAMAGAQAPQVEKNISMKMALMIIEGTLEQCTKDGYKVSVVVVDRAGNVAASVRGDGTNPHTMEFGRLKAYTARTRGQTSLEFKNLTDKPENAYLKQIPNVVAVGGGVPIKVGNEVIGAVGVSGEGPSEDDPCDGGWDSRQSGRSSYLQRLGHHAHVLRDAEVRATGGAYGEDHRPRSLYEDQNRGGRGLCPFWSKWARSRRGNEDDQHR